MRDQLDTRTGELPTIAPPPPRALREPKTNVADRKRLAHYTPPKQVDSCRNCKFVRATIHDPGSPFEHGTHSCGRNRFGVQLGAICDDYIGCLA